MKVFKWLYIYMYAFFIIYSPPFSNLYLNIPNQYVNIMFLIFNLMILLAIKKSKNLSIRKDITKLVAGIVVASSYFAIIATINGEDMRFFQNMYVVVQIVHVLIILDLYKIFFNFEKYKSINIFLNLAVFQAIISIFMILIPEFKSFALDLYYLGREENIFISEMRIFGISGDYTFFTPIYHSLLAYLVTVMTLFINFKYIYYLPFLFLVIVINGRYGILIYVMCILIVFLFMLFKRRLPKKLPIFIFLFFTIMSTILAVVYSFLPRTYNWIYSSVIDTVNFIFEGELTGTYSALMDSHLFFPRGWGFFMGLGHRVYGEVASLNGYPHSDIGYVNDLFMGGIIYLFILYGSIFYFLLNKFNRENIFIQCLVVGLCIFLIMSNYKGEVMRGGTILVSVIMIKMIFDGYKGDILRLTKGNLKLK